MARQPPLSVLLPLVLAGCLRELPYGGAFDVPVAAAVLQPEVGGPFQEPVAFVANAHGGQIVQLALKQGRFLTDDPTVSFLRTNPLPTGGDRVLTSVAVIAPSYGEVVVWAGDRRFGRLLRVPWLHDCEATPDRPECGDEPVAGAPVEQQTYWELVEQVGEAELVGVHTKDGYTATETWTIAFDGREWTVEGTRSGVDANRPVPGLAYSTESRRLNFTIQDPGQRAKAGDRFVIKTRSGLSEHDVGGAPLALSASPDQRLLATIVHDEALDRPFVRWFDPDPAVQAVVGEVALPEEAHPHRLAWSEDGALLVADRAWPAVWEIAPGETTAIEHPTPWPTLDVAALDGADRRRLYVVPLDGGSLWLLDRDTGAFVDVNAAQPGEQGMTFDIPVVGIEAMSLPYLMPEYSDDEIRVTGRSVAVSLADSTVVFAHEETGCLVQDNLGPRTLATSGLTGTDDYDASFEGLVLGPATLEPDGASGRHVVVNACAGIARPEEWELRFDQNQQAWVVEGSVSGVQQALAREDERYLSDRGEVSFTIRAGSTPSQDGWTIRFTVDAGIARATGDNDNDGVRDVTLGVSGDPTYFFYRVGLPGRVGEVDEGAGWYPVDVRPLVLVPGSSSNEVARVDPQRAALEVGWE